ncbi:cystatin family protein, partial [Salmonella enterica]|uniref:cystatin family protein n=1 Tax=Salmonella enterica TaxID=28901 RepID=UPI00329891C0
KRSRRGLLGGFSDADVNDAKIQEIGNFAVQAMDSTSSDRHIRRVEEILSASKQVVAGFNYRLNMKVYWTTCLKEDHIEDLSSCERDPSR